MREDRPVKGAAKPKKRRLAVDADEVAAELDKGRRPARAAAAPKKRAADEERAREGEGERSRDEVADAGSDDRGVKPRKNPPLPGSPKAALFDMLARWIAAPQPILRLELIRILAPLAVLGFMSGRLAHADEWLTNAGFQVPDLGHDDYRQPLYLSPLSMGSATALAVAMVASGLAVAAGFRARIAAIVFAASLVYVALADRLAAFTVSKLSPAVMLALAASPIGARFGVDAWLRRKKDPEVPLPDQVAGGGVRFFQLFLPVMYSASGIAKMQGDWLKNPLVMWTHIHDSYQTGFTYALARTFPGWMWTVLQAVVLIFEVGAPLWFAWARTRTVALVVGLGMHAMIGMMFWPVRWFAMLMAALLLGAYLPEALLTRAERRGAAVF